MSRFEEKIRSTNFVVTSELTPPKGIDLSDFFAKADALKGFVDAINITESPRARMAVEPKSVALLLQDRGLEGIVQLPRGTATVSPSRPTCSALPCSVFATFCS